MEMSANEHQHAWEFHKENTAPLERGRNANTLHSESNHLHSPTTQMKYESQIQHFENLVSPSEQAHFSDKDSLVSSDILIHWLSYIKFMQDTYPASTQPIFLLLERCARALLPVSKYRNDTRFIRVCILYADKTSSPSDVYKFLHQNKVGTETALFWVAWAWVAEKREDFKFCEKIFLKGLEKKAKPLHMLEKRHKQFQRRMCRHMLNRNASQNSMDASEIGFSSRGSLHQLSEKGVSDNQRSMRFNDDFRNQSGHGNPGFRINQQDVQTNFSSRQNQQSISGFENKTKKGAGFNIFVESNVQDEGYNLDQENTSSFNKRKLAKESDRLKENIGNTERWNERGGLDSSPGGHSRQPLRMQPPQAGPKFEVFVDESEDEEDSECLHKQNKKSMNANALKQRSKDGIADKLNQDPLRYVRNPEKMQKDITKQKKSTGKTKNVPEKKSTLKIDRKIDNASSQSGFDMKVISKQIHGQEMCFEEVRAKMGYFKILTSQNDFNLLEENKYDNSQGSPMSVEMEDVSVDCSVPVKTSENTPKPSRDSKRKLSVMQNDKLQDDNDSGLPMPRRLLPEQGERIVHHAEDRAINISNVSNASSTINVPDAVGVLGGNEEPTVNTKFAMHELSMMFSSPGITSAKAGWEEGNKPFFPVHTGNNEDKKEDDNCSSASHKDLPLEGRGRAALGKKTNKTLAFDNQIDGKLNNDKGDHVERNDKSTFEIYQDEKSFGVENDRDGGDTATFSIFNEIAGSLSPIAKHTESFPKIRKSELKEKEFYPSFSYTDSSSQNIKTTEDGNSEGTKRVDIAPTPSSIIGSALSKDDSNRRKYATRREENGLTRHEEKEKNEDDEGETATFSIFNDVFNEGKRTVEGTNENPHEEYDKVEADTTNFAGQAKKSGFTIFCDDDLGDISKELTMAVRLD